MDSPASLRARFFFGDLPSLVGMEPFTGRATRANLEDYWGRLRCLCAAADDGRARPGAAGYEQVASSFAEKVGSITQLRRGRKRGAALQPHLARKPWYPEYLGLRRTQRVRRTRRHPVIIEVAYHDKVVDLDDYDNDAGVY